MREQDQNQRKQVKEIVEKLRGINIRMTSLLNRVPLRDRNEAGELYRLAEDQRMLLEIQVSAKKVPMSEVIFFEKERELACHLKVRYESALSKGIVQP